MRRSFSDLTTRAFDLLIVGGGIYGAWAALDASLRGLSVALVERDDWAAGTSSASSKLVHGGLRYLELGRIGLVRAALAERARLVRLGPHRVWPLAFGLPVWRDSRVGRIRLGAGLWLYDRLAAHGFEPHRRLDSIEMAARYRFLRSTDLRGGFVFFDAQTDDARLVLELVAGALDAGVVAVNRAEALEPLRTKTGVAGAEVRDAETGEIVEVRARVTLSCAGPWIDSSLRGASDGTRRVARLSKGVHLVLPALPTPDACLLPSDDGRVVFLLPWYGRTVVGTTDTDHTGNPSDAAVDPRDVAFLLEQANRALGNRPWREADIAGSFVGLRALPVTGERDPSRVTREWSLIEAEDGLLQSVGGKLTSARADAAAAVDRVLQRLGEGPRPCPTADRPLPWCPAEPFGPWLERVTARSTALGLDPSTASTCAHRHGTRVDALLGAIEVDRRLAAPIVAGLPFCRGEIAFAAGHEMAGSLADVLLRRVPVGLLARLDATVLRDAADLAGDVLGWSAERKQLEVAAAARRA